MVKQSMNIKKRLRKRLYEFLINEAMKQPSDFTETTALYIYRSDTSINLVIYDYKKSDEIIGTISVSRNANGKGYTINGIATEKGYGPLMYELAMSYMRRSKYGLTPDRTGIITKNAFKLWEYFYDNRSDVTKLKMGFDDSNYNFSILDADLGSDKVFLDTSNDNESNYNELTDKNKKIVDIYNTYYSFNNNKFLSLIKRGKKFIEENKVDLETINEKSENYFNDRNPNYLNESDPKIGTGKKPAGSGRRLYTDENPKDTVSVKFRTKEDIVDTLNKESFKSKSHQRQSQIINLIHQRVRAAYENAKKPEVKKRLKRAFDYIETVKERSKEKTKKMQK